MSARFAVQRQRQTWAVVRLGEDGGVAALVEGGFSTRDAAAKAWREWSEDGGPACEHGYTGPCRGCNPDGGGR